MNSPLFTDLTVVCIYSRHATEESYGTCGYERDVADFSDEYVYRLKESVFRHIGDVQFVCFTNHELPGIETIKMKRSAGGWLDKLEIFSHQYPGPVLYLDLDVMLVSCIRDIVQRIGEFRFAGIREKRPMLMLNSSIMVFDGTLDWSALTKIDGDDLKATDNRLIFDRLGGDITWLEDIFPNRFVLYFDKKARNNDESVVVFQRYPRPHQVNWDHRLNRS